MSVIFSQPIADTQALVEARQRGREGQQLLQPLNFILLKKFLFIGKFSFKYKEIGAKSSPFGGS